LGGPGKPEDAEEPEEGETLLENAFIGRADARLSLAKYLPDSEGKALFEAAIKDSDLALETEPDYELAYYNRALARRLMGDLDGALEDFTKVIRTAPRLAASAILRRGIIYYYQNDFGLALADLEAASAMQDGRAQFWIGLIRVRQGDDMAALDAYSTAIRQNPGNSYAYYNRGLVYLRIGMYERALDDFNELLRRDNENAAVYRLRATAYRALDRPEEAANSLQAASQFAG
jgi:serine/threonine-protein kinase